MPCTMHQKHNQSRLHKVVVSVGDSPVRYMSPSPPPEPSQQGPSVVGGEERYGEEEEEEDISPDLWQEACWIVIRSNHTPFSLLGVHLWCALKYTPFK